MKDSRIINADDFTILYTGKYLNCDLAIVTQDPAALEIGWSMRDQFGETHTGTMTLQNPEGVTPEMKMRIILASIKQEYEVDQVACKIIATRGHKLQ